MTHWLYPLAWEAPSLFQNLISEPKSHSDLEIRRTSKYQTVKLPDSSLTPWQCVLIHGCPVSSLMSAGWGDPPHTEPPTHLLKVLRKNESEVAQSCPTLCDPMDCSLPGSSIHGVFQARILEWVAISFSRRSSQPRDWTQISHTVGRRFIVWATREVLSPVQKPGLALGAQRWNQSTCPFWACSGLLSHPAMKWAAPLKSPLES